MAHAVDEDDVVQCPKCGFRLRVGMTLYDKVVNEREDDATECPGCGTVFHNKNWRSRTFERQQERIEAALAPKPEPTPASKEAWEGGGDDVFEELREARPALYSEVKTICEIALAKGRDYSGEARGAVDNLRASKELGIEPWVGVLLRMNDKMTRLKRFVRSGSFAVQDEGVIDTLRDLANYALLAVTLFQETVGE